MFATLRRRGGDPAPAVYGPVAWKPLPSGAAPWSQIGVWGEAILSQFPARWEGLQLYCGVESLRSGWYTPSQSPLPNFQQSMQNNYANSPNRFGQTYTGPIGPITSRQLKENVTAAQIRQSGLQAMQWAQGLAGN